jgi:hypothetical protein
MVRVLLAFLLCCFPYLGCFAQEKNSRWRVGLYFEAVENRYSVFGDTNYGSNAITKSHGAYNFGTEVRYALTSWVSLQSGIGLSDLGYDLEYLGSGYPRGTYVHRVTYLDLPIGVQLFFSKTQKHFNFFASAGGVVSFLNGKEKPYLLNGTTALNLSNFDNFDEYAPILYNALIGIGILYNYSTRVSIEVLPIFRFSLNKNTYGYISSDSEWTKFQSSGVKLSIRYKL